MMKNSKLKFSEYMQNISRSKNFGRFVLIVLLSNNRHHSNKLLKSHKFSKQREKKHDYHQMWSLTAYDYFRQTKLHVLITLSENS